MNSRTRLELLPLILHLRPVANALVELESGAPAVTLPPVVAPALPVLWAATFEQTGRSMLVLVARDEEVEAVVESLGVYVTHPERIVAFPAYNLLPYERDSVQPEVTSARLSVLRRLYNSRRGGEPVLVVTSLKAALEPTLGLAHYERGLLEVNVGDALDAVAAARRLAELGYRPTSLVEEAGTFSRRGDILDVWSPTEPAPVRIELFGDDVESIRLFDPDTQRSESTVNRAVIAPPTELPLAEAQAASEALQQLDLSMLRPEVRAEWDQLFIALDNHEIPGSPGLLAPYFPNGMASLAEHLPPDTIMATVSRDRLILSANTLDAHAGKLRAELEQAGELPAALRSPNLRLEELETALASFQQLRESGDAADSHLFSTVTGFGGNISSMLTRLKIWTEEGKRVAVATRQANRLTHLLSEHDVPRAISQTGATTPPTGAVLVVHGAAAEGWACEELDLVVLTDVELWGYVEPRRQAAPRRHSTPAFLADLEPGGYVVHIDHGIARYVGNVLRGPQGAEREYLLLEYAAGDKLYVPVDQVDRISPYIGAGGVPALSRLGTADWARTKRRVKQAAEDLAQELLRIYAARELARGHSFSPDGSLQREFEEAFPYTETEDQLHALEEVSADMEAVRPMDRLICGDVGYGKTEVALRAAFKAVVDGKQVAMLVPTTVLALQHYETFTHRLAAFPVRVEMLSRLRSKQERDEVVAGLKSGAVDIVIGTHRLLQKDVGFKDLGLVIVDEEQRFGVKHKETLKRLRTEVDVLTLTATPIPRTLQMALVGVRDMSVIETPPADRLPIKTYIVPKTDHLIRESILREMDRDGQVFYVHNRVHDIAKVVHELQQIVPEARIAVGHGQMDEKELERVMLAFVRHEFDVLVCTTIIESGLDIPNVNTILVDDATHFGLAQLYQLRGRVGRGNHRAYAYLMYRPAEVMSEDAQKRLEAIAQATELGAGFRIAMKDLEIRGAGNFLGPEQSGHVGAVGLELYTQLLERAVQEARTGEKLPEPPAVSIDLPVEASLPESYIADRDTRLRLYRRLGNVAAERELRELESELRDRFGPLPAAVSNLVQILELKLLAADVGVSAISMLEGDVVLRVPNGMDVGALLGRRGIRLVPGQLRLTGIYARHSLLSDVRNVLIDLEDTEGVAVSTGRLASR